MERFRVVGKFKVTSAKGDFYFVHLIAHFNEREKNNGAIGDKAIVTMVERSEFEEIKLGIYEGKIWQNGRFSQVLFHEFIQES